MSSPRTWFLLRQWLSRIIFPEVWEWYGGTVEQNNKLWQERGA